MTWFRTNEGTWLPEWMYYDPAAPHLGGYAIDGDPGSYEPDLWMWLLKWRRVRSVLDVGCGAGISVRWFRDHGCDVLGLEGVPQPTDLPIVRHDFTTGPYRPSRRFDLCWSCEFVEHVEEAFMENFFSAFQAAEMLLITHALPGQGGHHHVNCQPDSYWIELLRPFFRLDRRLTRRTRELARSHGYYRQSGLAFIRV